VEEYSEVKTESESRIIFNTTTLHYPLWISYRFSHNLYVSVQTGLSFEQAESSRHFFPGFDIEIWKKDSKLNF